MQGRRCVVDDYPLKSSGRTAFAKADSTTWGLLSLQTPLAVLQLQSRAKRAKRATDGVTEAARALSRAESCTEQGDILFKKLCQAAGAIKLVMSVQTRMDNFLELSRPMSVPILRTRCCHPAAAGNVPYIYFFNNQHRSVSRKCGGGGRGGAVHIGLS